MVAEYANNSKQESQDWHRFPFMAERAEQPIRYVLAGLIQQAGLTESELAARTPYTQGTINKYKTGARGRVINEKTVKTISDITKALGLEPEFFLEVRIWHAWQEAVRGGRISLEALKMLTAGAEARGKLGGNGEDSL